MKTLLPEVSRFEQHLRTLTKKRGGLRYTERTVRVYALTMDRAMRAKDDPLAVLRTADTTAKWLLASNAVLAWADWKNDEALRRSAANIADPGEQCEEVKPPTDAEWGAVLRKIDTLPEPWRGILTVLTTSGLRFGDVVHITRAQAVRAQTNREITIHQKGMKIRSWAPGTDSRNAFASLVAIPDWQEIRDLIPLPPTTGVDGTQREVAAYHQVRKMLQHVCADAGVEYIRPHRFRHAVSESARRHGMTTEERQKLLGHADYRTTNKYYTHTEAERQIAVVDSVIAGVRRSGKEKV